MPLQERLLPYRLAAIDIDDTLIGHDKQISPANRAAVRQLQEAGVDVVLASGRAAKDMEVFRDALGLTGPLVCMQGALALDPDDGTIFHEHPLPPDDAARIVRDGIARGHTVFAFGRDQVIANRPSKWVAHWVTEAQQPPIVGDPLSDTHGSIYKVVWAADPEVVARLDDELTPIMAHRRVQTVITNPWYFEFMAAGTDKSAGLAAIARHLDVPKQEVLAFGDGNNDVAMLRWAGLGIAMPAGRPGAIAAADRVAPAGAPESALARAIAELLALRY